MKRLLNIAAIVGLLTGTAIFAAPEPACAQGCAGPVPNKPRNTVVCNYMLTCQCSLGMCMWRWICVNPN